MRRSCAPSMQKMRVVEKRRRIEELFGSAESIYNEVTPANRDEGNWDTSSKMGNLNLDQLNQKHINSFSSKLIFNVVWREITKKKHKTWNGDGLLEVQVDVTRAVIKDSDGKYMGCNTKFNVNDLKEGHQMVVGGKEIELLEQIIDPNDYFALLKKQTENRWNEEQNNEQIKGKQKVSTLYQGSFQIENKRELKESATASVLSEANQAMEVERSLSNKLLCNVVWRELSTRKNKTWSGDGIFEVNCRNNKGILRDQNGRKIAEENINLTELEVGTILALGDKEFEILEIIKQDSTERLSKIKEHSFVKIESHLKKAPKLNTFLLPPPSIVNATGRSLQPVEVSHKLAQHLRPHQRDGIIFMYKCIMGFHTPMHRGCILADDMGLGKTLQCIVLAHTLLKGGPYGGERELKRILIVTPSSLTRNWENEINKWLKNERMYAFVVGGKRKLDDYSKQHHVPFVIVSYESLLAHLENFQQLKFDLLICDEGHRLKNHATKVAIALRELNIIRRIIVSGTPIQNDLSEFYALADFANPGIFGTPQEFHLYYELPIQQSQSLDASDEVKDLAAQRTNELMAISDNFMLRRLQHLNNQYLPKKYEYICFVQPSELQQFMLQKALHLYAQRKETILKDLTPLQIITVLKKICNHPSLIARTKTPNLLTRNLENYLPDCSEMGPFDSAKLELVQNIFVTSVVENREKCVLVSNHTKTLNMLQGLCDYLNIKCLRLDGFTCIKARNANVERFNSSDEDSLVFLLSAKAGGVGLNLIGASRLILFDQDWNPATDAQAMSRIWREGQHKDVHIYRLVTAGCIEEKIFQRQIAKVSLSDCVTQNLANNKNDSMKFSRDELLDLFNLQDDYSTCQTHESLNCKCKGDGENCMPLEAAKYIKQINELVKWQHYKPPFDVDLLQAASLEKACDNLIYIFANQTGFNN